MDKTPHPYQERVAQTLLTGKSVILQAPTGSGKTYAALWPFLHAQREEVNVVFPAKCIYSVPMRVLANQFYKEYDEIADSFARRFKQPIEVGIQTGEYPKDSQFTSDLTFCTIDQFLASYLHMPYGLPHRLANINAGAFVGAYLVFDEFHLLDPNSTLPTTLYAIQRLSKVAPVLLMTATFSATMLGELKKKIHNCEVVLVDPAEAQGIETAFGEQEKRQRTWQVAEAPLTAQAVWDQHQKRSLAICNTVRSAQALYRELKTLAQGSDVKLLMLHSRFLPQDRQRIEQEIKTLFARGNTDSSVIAVTTQTIEVGVDITSEILHTELAPASALIQRAGRCARYPGETGNVIVYPVETLRPYGSESENSLWGKEMLAALEWLKARQGEVFDFGKEQEFVNAVATPRDQTILENISAARAQRREDILKALRGEENSLTARELIRNVDSKRVLIHPNPDELTENPYQASGVSISTNTLRGMVKEWLEREADVKWSIKRLIEDEGDGESYQTEYDWVRLSDVSEVGAAQVLVVNPELAGYLPDEGFVPERGNTGFVSAIETASAGKRPFPSTVYRKESYEDHIRRVLEAFQDNSLEGLQQTGEALEKAAGWTKGSVLRAAWLACLLHDVGKLNQAWQGWARAYQKEVGMPVTAQDALGHTEYDRKNQEHLDAEKRARKKHPRPPHAGESALAVARIMARSFPKEEAALAKAALTAITRHHAPFANECKAFALEESASRHVFATFKFVPAEMCQMLNLELLTENAPAVVVNDFPKYLAKPENDLEWLAYSLLARILRQSDQEGTKRGSQP